MAKNSTQQPNSGSLRYLFSKKCIANGHVCEDQNVIGKKNVDFLSIFQSVKPSKEVTAFIKKKARD